MGKIVRFFANFAFAVYAIFNLNNLKHIIIETILREFKWQLLPKKI